jgi:hypothetical protein
MNKLHKYNWRWEPGANGRRTGVRLPVELLERWRKALPPGHRSREGPSRDDVLLGLFKEWLKAVEKKLCVVFTGSMESRVKQALALHPPEAKATMKSLVIALMTEHLATLEGEQDDEKASSQDGGLAASGQPDP